jgi:hypothetical protein
MVSVRLDARPRRPIRGAAAPPAHWAPSEATAVLTPYHPTWQPGQGQIAAGGGAGPTARQKMRCAGTPSGSGTDDRAGHCCIEPKDAGEGAMIRTCGWPSAG